MRRYKQADQALAYFAKACAINPDLPYAQGDWLRARLVTCQWAGDSPATAEIEIAFDRLRAGIDQRQRVATPFQLLAVPATPAQQKLCGELYCEDRTPTAAAVTDRANRASKWVTSRPISVRTQCRSSPPACSSVTTARDLKRTRFRFTRPAMIQ